MPVATTTPRPRPFVTCVAAYARLRRSPSETSLRSIGWVCLSTGSDSPVSAASWTRRFTASISRRSAGTTFPASSATTSPGTSSTAGISTTRPSRYTRTVGTASRRSAAMAFSARYSCTKPSSVKSTTIAKMAPASRNLPRRSESVAAPIRMSTITAVSCSQMMAIGRCRPPVDQLVAALTLEPFGRVRRREPVRRGVEGVEHLAGADAMPARRRLGDRGNRHVGGVRGGWQRAMSFGRCGIGTEGLSLPDGAGERRRASELAVLTTSVWRGTPLLRPEL